MDKTKKIHLKTWEPIADDIIALHYENNITLHIRKADFDRAFGAIVYAGFDAVKKEFAIK